MKLTKSKLRQIIREEVEALTEKQLDKRLQKKLSDSWNVYKGGKKDSGFIQIDNDWKMQKYVEKHAGQKVKSYKQLAKGETYPYNRSNPYSHDIWRVTLADGTTFNLERQYGTPNWSGKVEWVERITAS